MDPVNVPAKFVPEIITIGVLVGGGVQTTAGTWFTYQEG